ncbi:MAG: type VI secretion system tip protein TssI/VgrG [Acidobacteriota bacterium]
MARYTQDNRFIRIETPLGKDVLLLRGFRGHEGVSQLFEFDLYLHSENRAIAFNSIMGKKATIKIKLSDGSERCLNGLIGSFSQGGSTTLNVGNTTATFASYSAKLVPWLWMLKHTSDCRIFQNQTALDIIQQVFDENQLKDYKIRTQGSFSEREYCVQWNETDLDFVLRLMEEEGIFYFFEHEETKHTLVLANQPSEFKPCPYGAEARYGTAQGAGRYEEIVTDWNFVQQVRPGKVEIKDFNFEQPTMNLTTSVTGQDERKLEVRYYPGDYFKLDEGEKIVGIRMEEQATPTTVVQGISFCRNLASGYRFELKDYYRRDLVSKPFVLTEVRHESEQGNNYLATASQARDDFEYSNSFQCIPHSVPFRPPRVTPRPIIHGSQTAIIVGPPGEEIFVDKYARVKVQFHWDREGKYDDKSSCWMRVSQAHAGKSWGAVHLPRIGQEVIVSFLDGDPDRPIITGMVYNGESMPPYTLPDEKTKTTFKSYSSKGGGGFNELRFEDKKGSEQVFLHAEKELDIRVKNDRREWIGRDRHLIIKRDRKDLIERDQHTVIKRDLVEAVKRDHHLKITGKQATEVGGSQSLKVAQNVGEKFDMNHSEEVGMNFYLKAGMNVVIEAGIGLTIKAGSNFITLSPAGIMITGSPLVLINSGGAALPGTPGQLVPPMAPGEAEIADNADPGSKEPTYKNQRQIAQASMSPGEIAASEAPSHDPTSEENKEKKSWIEIELVDDQGKPVPGEKYRVTLPDGTTIDEGTLDDKGFARIDGIDPGTCKITFPNLDKDAWKPK